MHDIFTRDQWRRLYEVLCDGQLKAAMPMTFIKQFKDAPEIYFWLRRNKVQGKKLVELFKERGNLGAVQFIRDRIHGRKFTSEKVTVRDLN